MPMPLSFTSIRIPSILNLKVQLDFTVFVSVFCGVKQYIRQSFLNQYLLAIDFIYSFVNPMRYGNTFVFCLSFNGRQRVEYDVTQRKVFHIELSRELHSGKLQQSGNKIQTLVGSPVCPLNHIGLFFIQRAYKPVLDNVEAALNGGQVSFYVVCQPKHVFVLQIVFLLQLCVCFCQLLLLLP